MIKETERIQKVVEKHRYCDICGNLSKTYCTKCGKDLCNKCVKHEDYDSGDYRGNCYCAKCWDLGEDIRRKISDLEYEIEELSEEWDKLCKAK